MEPGIGWKLSQRIHTFTGLPAQTIRLMTKFFVISIIMLALAGGAVETAYGEDATAVPPMQRFVAIDNVCAWPNLTTLPDGTITAAIFNQPSHARAEGDVECWSSTNGEFWTKLGVVTAHDPMANRMNVGVGLTKSGRLIVLASGWSLKRGDNGTFNLRKALPICACTSSDGRTWEINNNAFPNLAKGTTDCVPFGNIFPADDGTLRGTVYGNSNGVTRAWMVAGDSSGKTWKLVSLICTDHNETTLFPISSHEWIAAARHGGAEMGVDVYRSTDDGKTWQFGSRAAGEGEGPADIIRLADGRLLLACGNRNKGHYGVTVRFSSDDGAKWTPPQTLVDDLLTLDCGYPSSVQRPDGRVVTAYYSHFAPDHQRYHMGVVIWSPSQDVKSAAK